MNFKRFDPREVFTDYTENLKEYVVERDNRMCQACSCATENTPHHIIFRSQGGKNVSTNLITLCNVCHDKVHKTGKFKISPDTLLERALKNEKVFRGRLV